MSAIPIHNGKNEWWVDFRIGDQRIRRRSPVQTRRGAEAFELELRLEFAKAADTAATEAPASVLPASPPFAAFVEKYLIVHTPVHFRPSTQRTTASKLRARLVPWFGTKRLDEITTYEIALFKAHQVQFGLRPKTVNSYLSILHSALLTAQEWGLVNEVPKIKWVPSKRPTFRVITHEESIRLIAAAPSDLWRPLIAFLVRTGARFGEAAALRWEDLELDGPEPVVHLRRAVCEDVVGPTKTDRERDVPLLPELVRELRAYGHSREYVFSRPADGRFLSPASTRKHLHRICERAGVKPISWHVFRHTFATELLTRFAPLPAVQKLLGHTTIEMTARYAHALAPTVRASVMLLDDASYARRARIAMEPPARPVWSSEWALSVDNDGRGKEWSSKAA